MIATTNSFSTYLPTLAWLTPSVKPRQTEWHTLRQMQVTSPTCNWCRDYRRNMSHNGTYDDYIDNCVICPKCQAILIIAKNRHNREYTYLSEIYICVYWWSSRLVSIYIDVDVFWSTYADILVYREISVMANLYLSETHVTYWTVSPHFRRPTPHYFSKYSGIDLWDKTRPFSEMKRITIVKSRTL